MSTGFCCGWEAVPQPMRLPVSGETKSFCPHVQGLFNHTIRNTIRTTIPTMMHKR